MESIIMEKPKINGARYAVTVHRDDSSLPYLLMLHGFMGDGRVFEHLIKDLSGSCNPITVDLLGHGKSEKNHDPDRYNENRQASDIIELVKSLGYDPLFLYGYSMGGRLALKAAIAEPQLFQGLILESTNSGIHDEGERSARLEVDKNRASKIKQDYEAFLAKWEELALFQSPLKTDQKLTDSYKNRQLRQDPKAMAASIVGFSTGAMKPVKNHSTDFTKPVLIIAGTKDQKYIKQSHSLADYFDNARVSHIKAGHRVHLDNPKALSQELTFFIEQNTLL